MNKPFCNTTYRITGSDSISGIAYSKDKFVFDNYIYSHKEMPLLLLLPSWNLPTIGPPLSLRKGSHIRSSNIGFCF